VRIFRGRIDGAQRQSMMSVGEVTAEEGRERLFLQQQKSTTFFHARISRSGKGRVSDSPRVAEKVTHEAPTASGIREVEKSTFFGEVRIFFAKLAFSAVIYGI
jgi:hypothetical protein